MAEGLIPLLAGVVSAAFAAFVAREYATKRRPHQLAWAMGLATYSLASFLEAYVTMEAWSVLVYRLYFPAAAATVGLLGAGTILLATRQASARAFTAFILLLVAVASIAPLSVPLGSDAFVGDCVEDAGPPCKRLAEWGPELGAKAIPFSNAGRLAFLALNVIGGLALIGGAVWTWSRARRSPGILLIGLGAMMPFAGGSLSTFFALDLRVTLQFVGIVIMFAGYLYGRDMGARGPGSERDAVEA